MHIDEYLNNIAKEEQEKRAAEALEGMFDHMSIEDVLKIATSDQKGKAPGDAPEANVNTYSSGAMSAHKRESLPSKSFAIPETKAKKIGVAGEIKGEAKGKYPIPDLTHARNALARVSQHGTPPERQAVRSKVYAKYPQLKAGFEERHGGASPTSKGNIKKETQGEISKSAAQKMVFVEKLARQIAQTHHELAKKAGVANTLAKHRKTMLGSVVTAPLAYMGGVAHGYTQGKAENKTKEDAFTTPEAKAKAQVMSRALKSTKGAPPNVRKSAVKLTAQKLKSV